MTGLPQNVPIFLYTQAVDFRKGFDGLTGLVTAALGHQVTDGSLFLFVNRKRNRIKALWWEAAAYVRRHWKALIRFVDDASIPIDNNDCEQLLKRVAVGRKNWLFKGSLAAGERAQNLLAIVGSAVLDDLDVAAYLDDALRRALAGETGLESMVPYAWKAEHPKSIRVYRQNERRQAADRKKQRRARRRLSK